MYGWAHPSGTTNTWPHESTAAAVPREAKSTKRNSRNRRPRETFCAPPPLPSISLPRARLSLQIGVLFPVRRPLLSTNLLRFPPRARSHPQSRSTSGAAHLSEANADAAALLRPHASRPPLVLGLRGYAGAGLNFCRNVFLCDLFFFSFFESHLSRFLVCADSSNTVFVTPCLRFSVVVQGE